MSGHPSAAQNTVLLINRFAVDMKFLIHIYIHIHRFFRGYPWEYPWIYSWIYPWMHWATLRRHSCLSRAATSASSQVSVIFRRSFLTVPIQLALGRAGPLLKAVGGPSAERDPASAIFFMSMFSMLCCPVLVLIFAFVTLSFHEIHNILLCHHVVRSIKFFSSVLLIMATVLRCTIYFT